MKKAASISPDPKYNRAKLVSSNKRQNSIQAIHEN